MSAAGRGEYNPVFANNTCRKQSSEQENKNSDPATIRPVFPTIGTEERSFLK
jgi:hypothetical protein